MTPAQTAKAAGLKTLTEMSQISNVPIRTLQDWHKNNHQLFMVVLTGCVTIKTNCEKES